jgi:hypothetical protein
MYMTCEFDSNFPGPTIPQIVAGLRAIYDGKHAVTTGNIAASVGGDGGAVADALRRASNIGLVRQVRGGWVPTTPF